MRVGCLEMVEPSSVTSPATVSAVGHGPDTDTPPSKEQVLWKIVEHNEYLSGTQREQLYLLLLSYMYQDLFA